METNINKADFSKKLADLLFDPTDGPILSKDAVRGVAIRLYGRIGNKRAEKFLSVYEQKKHEIEKAIDGYTDRLITMNDITALFDTKSAQRLMYRIISSLEKDLNKCGYDFPKLEELMVESFSQF